MSARIPQAVSRLWHQQKYAIDGELAPQDTQWRVAQALANVEVPARRALWARRFFQVQAAGLLPAGRIMAGAGRPSASLINCFVLPVQPLAELSRRLRRTLAAGGGVGLDFSTLPGGVVAAMDRCEALALDLQQRPAPARRAAQMAVLRIDHPEIDAFLDLPAGQHPHFTRSVALRDADLHMLLQADADGLGRRWQALCRKACDEAEPGLLFLDRMQADDNLGLGRALSATNPCGEQPLPPFGACALASIDLTRVIQQPWTDRAHVSWGMLASLVHVGVRLLDNVLECTEWPLREQADLARQHRRIGLGITGLGDALALLGLHYGSPQAQQWAAAMMRFVAHGAYRASIRLARERGPYPAFKAETVLAHPHFASRLPADLRHDIRMHGLRHSHLLALAPAASISMAFADAVSPGVQPITAAQWLRVWHDPQGLECRAWVQSPAWRAWQALKGVQAQRPPPLVWRHELSPDQQLAQVAAMAPNVDGGISHTVWMPLAAQPEDVARVFRQAWRAGLKGVTVFREGSRCGVVDVTGPASEESVEQAARAAVQ